MKKSKSNIEHNDDDSKGNVNTNTINIKNSINLGDLVKQLKAKPKAKKSKKKGGGGGVGLDQMAVEQIQGPPGMPGQAGMAGINAMPNQPFIPNQPSPPLLAQLEKSYTAIEKDLETAKKLGITIPEELKINQSLQQSIDPTDAEQLLRIIDELDRDDTSIRNIIAENTNASMPPLEPSRPRLERSGSTQSVVSGLEPPPLSNRSTTLEDLAFSNRLPIKQPLDIFSSSSGERSLERISSNSVKPKADDFNFEVSPSPVNNRPASIFPSTPKDEDKKRMREKEQETQDNLKLLNDSFDAGNFILPSSFFNRDNNSTQSGLQLARSGSTQSVESGLPPPKYSELPQPSNFFSDVLALKNAPKKTQQQILRDLINEPLNIQDVAPPNQTARKELRVRPERVKKDYSKPPEIRPIVEEARKFRQEIERSRNIPPQSSLLEQITMTKPKPPPPERNLLGQAFGAFSNLLSSSRDVRDASAYGGVALGIAQPELLPAIGALETANQALNIIEAPVGSIERAIQQSIDRPKYQTYRTDSYGQRYDKITNKPLP